MIVINEQPCEIEAMAMHVVANNNPGEGEYYIEMIAYRGLDDDDRDIGMVGYDFRLGWFPRAIEMRQLGEDADHPEELLGLVPRTLRNIMRAQIAKYREHDLPRLLDGSLAWDEEYGIGEGTKW